MIKNLIFRLGWIHKSDMEAVAKQYMKVAYDAGRSDALKDEIPENIHASLVMMNATKGSRKIKERV